MRNRLQILLFVFLCLLTGCTGLPDGIAPVRGFELQPYLGKWYEIARLDHSFERGLQQVTATYSLRDDGGVRVINRGFNTEDKAWSEAEGRAYFVGPADVGHLKVSFFGPFFGSYVIFELGESYDYVFLTGNSREYLWLLARTPQVDDALYRHFLDRAAQLGFDTTSLIRVDQPAAGL